jgi:uncharacterized protein (DUF305 family)
MDVWQKEFPVQTRALILSVLILMASPAFAQESHSNTDHSAMNHAAMEGASKEYMDAMARMSEAMNKMTMTGKADTDFAEMMIPHHQAAIDMAKSYLTSGDNDPELTRMSNEIIAAQEREIDMLRSWLARNK